MNNQLLEIIKGFELELLDPNVRKSESRLDVLLADDFFEFGASGTRWTKQDTLRDLPKHAEVKYTTHDFAIHELSLTIVLATYRVEKENLDSGEKKLSLRSSLWQNHNGRWQMIFHQGTSQS